LDDRSESAASTGAIIAVVAASSRFDAINKRGNQNSQRRIILEIQLESTAGKFQIDIEESQAALALLNSISTRIKQCWQG